MTTASRAPGHVGATSVATPPPPGPPGAAAPGPAPARPRAHACGPESGAQQQVRAEVNESRRAHGLHALRDEWLVRDKAQAWAEHLARTGSLSHSRLSEGLGALPWTAIAENVGYGGSIAAVHDQFMRSSGHRANVLDRRWDVMGAGQAVARDGRVFVVHVFVALP